jgi:hypothetical protein
MKPEREHVGMITTPRSLSPRDYAMVAVVMAVLGVLLLLLFVGLIAKLLSADALNQFFYVVLIVWGLISSVVLFGVLKSYASLTYKHLNWMVELGGPAAFTAIILIGGFVLLPRTDTFDLTVRPHGPGRPKITSGKLTVQFGNSSVTRDLDKDGEADFKGVPHKFWGRTVKVLPEIEGFRREFQTISIESDAVDVEMVEETPPKAFLKGILVPAPRAGQVTTVLILGEAGSELPDTNGRFQFTLRKRQGDTVRVQVCINGWRVFDQYMTLTDDEVQIPLRRPDIRCRS